MITLVLNIGDKLIVDDETHTVTKVADVSDGDMGSGDVVRRKVITIRSNLGYCRTIVHEAVE